MQTDAVKPTLEATVYQSVADVPIAAWNQVVGPEDTFMRLPLIAALEAGWGRGKRIWPVVIFDAGRQPHAVACLFGHTIDLAKLGNPKAKSGIEFCRRFYPGFMHVNTLVCGLPLPVGHGGVRLAPHADQTAVARALSRNLGHLAWKHWFQAITVKDVDAYGITQQSAMEAEGFLTSKAPPMNVMSVKHTGIDDWLHSLRSHYRYAWKKSLKKFDRQDLRCSHLVGDEILQLYSRRTHRLYASLAKGQNLCFERMPFRFFRQLIAACRDQVRMTAIHAGDECVAFCWSLFHNGIYQNMLCGYNRKFNKSSDLYFNLAIRDMDYGMGLGAKEIWFGQTTEEFKARLGAERQPRHVYVRCVKPVTAALRAGQKWVLPPNVEFATRNIYRLPPQPQTIEPGRRSSPPRLLALPT